MSEYTTIAAIATPPGMGAVAIIRVSGPDAKQIVGKSFKGRSSDNWQQRVQHFGKIVDPSSATIDEVLLTWFRGPQSFTGEDVVEIATHGGVVVTKAVLDQIFENGAEPAGPGEFSQRAFFNGKIDLTQAEAIMDLISAQTELAAKAAHEQLSGRLGAELETIRQSLISLLAHLEAFIDFPDEDIDPDSSQALLDRLAEIIQRVDQLLSTADQGRILREGVRTVICGAPNAGKSSLLNHLLGFDRAIVNEAAGTTRDTIEEIVNLRGIPLRLIDTAGIREGGEAIEREGIERSRAQIANAELVILVIDSHVSAEEIPELNGIDKSKIVTILNKSDLSTHPDWADVEGISVSCLTDPSIEILMDSLYDQLTKKRGFDTANLVAINARHQKCLAAAKDELEKGRETLESGVSPEFVAMDLRAALASIGEVIGKTDVEEILGEIFSSFCIGK